MFDHTNHYTLRMETAEGITRYYVSFLDGQGISRETRVSKPVYQEFLCFAKRERNLRRSDERHREHSELTDETLYNRAMHPPKSVEDRAFDRLRNEKLNHAIQELPEIQRRRLVLHYELGLTYPQIAKMEDCSIRAIGYSIAIAKKTVKNFFKNRLPD